MAIQPKDYLINKFKQGDIPTGQDFRDFIESFIASINGETPGPDGNVEVPVAYQVVPMFNPGTPPTDFKVGTSVLVFDYDPATMPEWLDIIGPDVPAGKQLVITEAYPEEGVYIQRVDTQIDGFLDYSLTRVNIPGTNEWGPITNTRSVRSVNGVRADEDGNITVDNLLQSVVAKPELTFHYFEWEYTTPNWLYEFNIDVPGYNPQTDVIEVYQTGGTNPTRLKESDFYIKSYADPVMSIELLNGKRTNKSVPISVWRYKYSEMPRFDGIVEDGVNSESIVNAASANSVRRLNEGQLAHKAKVADFFEIGHVRTDEVSITANEQGIISVIGGGNAVTTGNVTKHANFSGTVTGTLEKQGIFTRLNLNFVNPEGVTATSGQEVIIGTITAAFRPTNRPAKFYIGDNTLGNKSPRHAITVYTNGNIGWTPSVDAGYWTMEGSFVY